MIWSTQDGVRPKSIASPQELRYGPGLEADATITVEGERVMALGPQTPVAAACNTTGIAALRTPDRHLPLYDIDLAPSPAPQTPRYAVRTREVAASPATPDWWLPLYDVDPLGVPHVAHHRCDREHPGPQIMPMLTPMSVKTDVAPDHEFLLQQLSPEKAKSFCNLVTQVLSTNGEHEGETGCTSGNPPCCPNVHLDTSPPFCHRDITDRLSWLASCVAPAEAPQAQGMQVTPQTLYHL